MSGKTYSTGKPLPPRHEWVPRVFRRAGTFYVIDLPEDDDLAEHARLNPGTLRIEDTQGNQLWPPRLAIAMEAATAGETCNRLAPKDDSAGRKASPKGSRHE